MLYVDNHGLTDPRINLALEEFLLRHTNIDETLLLLYVNEPAVIIGRNQNVWQELNPGFIKKNNIHVVRRLSGGGTVYHDLGNLNYSFISEGQRDLHKFARVTTPIIRVLQNLGVEAELRGRSDIVVGGKKISGNAQYASRGRMFSHGTLLVDSDITSLNRAIKPRQAQIESRAVTSVRSSVRNIREIVPTMTTDDLKRAILQAIFGLGRTPTFDLTQEDWRRIKQISEERYMSWEWNIGRSPRFQLSRSGQFANGTAEIRLDVDRGIIKSIVVSGEHISGQTGVELAKKLTGVRYDPQDLLAALRAIETEPFFANFSKEAFVDLLY